MMSAKVGDPDTAVETYHFGDQKKPQELKTSTGFEAAICGETEWGQVWAQGDNSFPYKASG